MSIELFDTTKTSYKKEIKNTLDSINKVHTIDNISSLPIEDMNRPIVKESDAYRNLMKIRREGKLSNGTGVRPESKENIKYLLGENEMFARAYTQWIGQKSKNQVILSKIKEYLESASEINSLNYWNNKDFKKISKALDTIFKEGDWLK